MTRIMPRHAPRKTRADILNLEHTHQKRTQFKGARCHDARTLAPFFIIRKQLREVMHHRRARPRWTDDGFRPALFVNLDETLCELARFRAIASVKGWLTTACLPLVEFHLAACASENFNGARAHVAPQLIHETCHEQRDSHDKRR